ncbi:MAG: hypothetical protein ABSG68_11690 [Thermoguttaceae bacterium]|jgi:hypothetical protein
MDTQVKNYVIVDAKPDQHNLAELVRSTLSAAKEAGLCPCLYFYSDLSWDCKVLRQNLDHPLMVDAFAGMYVLRVSAQEFRLRARDLGFTCDFPPALFRLDDQGKIVGRIDPRGWGFKGTPEKMAEALKRFSSEEAGHRSEVNTLPASPAPAPTNVQASPSALVVRCSCGSRLQVPPQWSGRQVQCPYCRRTLQVRGGQPAPATPLRPALPSPTPATVATKPSTNGEKSGAEAKKPGADGAEGRKPGADGKKTRVDRPSPTTPVPPAVAAREKKTVPTPASPPPKSAPATTTAAKAKPSENKPAKTIPSKKAKEPHEDRSGSEILLEAATPAVYRVNAFRVIGIAVDAGACDVSRYAEMLRMQERLGIAAPVRQGVLPLAPLPDAMAIRDAMQRLHDPERRLVDEFFWFWPQQFGQSKTDEALRALTEGSTKTAHDTWLAAERQSSDGNVSRHNLAVLAHVTALDFEHLSGQRTLTDDERQQRDQSWADTLQRWKALLEHEGFWSRLSARIRDLTDPRLTTGTARRFRNSLPLALLSINARLAVHAAEREERSEAARHVTIIRQSGFQESVLNEVLRRAVEPIRQRIKLACQAAQASADAEPEHADQAAQRLLGQTRPLLNVLDSVLGTGHPIRDGAYDEVALTALRSQVAFGRKTENWEVSLQLLRQALPLAIGRSVRSNIEENIRIVEGNLQNRQTFGTCWFCKTRRPDDSAQIEAPMHGNVRRRVVGREYIPGGIRTNYQVTWQQATVRIPRCCECKKNHTMIGKWTACVGLLGIALGILAVVAAGLYAARVNAAGVSGGAGGRNGPRGAAPVATVNPGKVGLSPSAGKGRAPFAPPMWAETWASLPPANRCRGTRLSLSGSVSFLCCLSAALSLGM